MLCRMLRRIERFLREHQDPRYRNLPWILPRAWHGSGGPLTNEQLARFNAKDMGFDPAIISQQPFHRMLRANRGAERQVAKQEKQS